MSLHLPEGWKQQSWCKSKDADLLRTLVSGKVRVGPPAGTRPAQYTWGGVLPPWLPLEHPSFFEPLSWVGSGHIYTSVCWKGSVTEAESLD